MDFLTDNNQKGLGRMSKRVDIEEMIGQENPTWTGIDMASKPDYTPTPDDISKKAYIRALNKLYSTGTDKSNMISAMIWLSDIRTRHDFNPIWDAWVPEGSAPVRACVEARLAEPSDLVEIQVTAYK